MSGTQRMAKVEKISMVDVATLTERLGEILKQENALLDGMKVAGLQELQAEKLLLVNALEAHRKLLAKHPSAAESIPSMDRAEMEERAEIFKQVLNENYRKLELARNVNEMVVRAIKDVAAETNGRPSYGDNGVGSISGPDSIPMTLNQTI